MPIFNDLNLENWKESEIWTDSLWIIQERDKSGKHNGFYHGNFVPQIPRQLILRYSKKGEVVFDPFVGSGTTAYEAETFGRHFIGIDIQKNHVEQLKSKVDNKKYFSEIILGDSSKNTTFDEVSETLKKQKKKNIYLAIVIGDKYTAGQWIPLGFYCMNEAQKLGLTLKSIIIKNMAGNRAKQNKEGIWRYRALSSDYYIFKHEYILIFKK